MPGQRILIETSDHLRPRIIALIALGIAILTVIGVTIATLMSGSAFPDLGTLFSSDNVTPLTLLIAGFGSGLFFIPIPAEFIYLYGIRNGTPVLLGAIAAISGFVAGHVVSYLIGLKLSRLMQYFLSPKKLYGLRRAVNKWGVYAILLVNGTPGPSPQLTFGLGLARYNFVRLITFVIIGNIVKYAVFAGIGTFT